MENMEKYMELNLTNINELNYAIVPDSLAAVLKKGKASFLNKGVLKKLIKSIETNTVQYVKIYVAEPFFIETLSSSYDEGYDTYAYSRMRTESGSLIDMGVQLMYKYTPEIGSTAYLLQFKIKKDIRYIIVESMDQEYLLNHTKELSSIEMSSSNMHMIPELEEEGLLDKGIRAIKNKWFNKKE